MDIRFFASNPIFFFMGTEDGSRKTDVPGISVRRQEFKWISNLLAQLRTYIKTI